MHMAVISREEDEEIMRSIDEKVENIDCGDENVVTRLKEILVRNRSLFRECPRRIDGYAHDSK